MPTTVEPQLANTQSRGAWLRHASQLLEPALRRDAATLLADVLHVDRAHMAASLEDELSAPAAAEFMALVERRSQGEPLAYLTGRREFWSIELRVTPSVLVPRPETELVVERALALCSAQSAMALDLGTGSGAIALALARERPHWRITATDRSGKALAVARENALALACANVDFAQGQWLAAIDPPRQFDLIVSNPPYVAAGDAALESDGLRYEPVEALVAGGDGLDDLRAITQNAPQYLRTGSWLVLEHGSLQAPEVRKLLVARGFIHVRSHLDLAGRERVTEGSWR